MQQTAKLSSREANEYKRKDGKDCLFKPFVSFANVLIVVSADASPVDSDDNRDVMVRENSFLRTTFTPVAMQLPTTLQRNVPRKKDGIVPFSHFEM